MTTLTIIFAFVVVLVLLVLSYLWNKLRSEERKLSHLQKVPRKSIFSGSAQEYLGNGIHSLELVAATSEKFDYAPWVIPGGIFARPYVVVPSYVDAQKLLRKNTDKGGIPKLLYYPNTPPTIVSADGLLWKRHRELLEPAFDHKNMLGMVPSIDKIAKTGVEYIRKAVKQGDESVDVHNLCSRIALDVVGELVYGEAFGAVGDPNNRAHFAAHQLSLISMKNFTNPFHRYFRMSQNDYKHAEDILDEVAKTHMKKKSVATDGSPSLPHVLQKAKDAHGLIYPTSEDFFEELRLVVNAAHDPAIPLSFALWEVSRKPEVYAKAKAEIKQVFGDSDREFQASDLQKVPYITAIFREAIRLWPVSGSGTVRKLEQPLETAHGVTVPTGVLGLVPFYTVMRSTKEWKDPNNFQPERFENDKLVTKSMLPFSGGPRMCPGHELALYEGVVCLVRFLQHFEFKPSKQTLQLECGIHIMPKNIILSVTEKKKQ